MTVTVGGWKRTILLLKYFFRSFSVSDCLFLVVAMDHSLNVIWFWLLLLLLLLILESHDPQQLQKGIRFADVLTSQRFDVCSNVLFVTKVLHKMCHLNIHSESFVVVLWAPSDTVVKQGRPVP